MAANASIRKKNTVFTIAGHPDIPVVFLGQLENQLFSSFSSLRGFDCEALAISPGPPAMRADLARLLAIMATNSAYIPEPLDTGRQRIDPGRLRELADRYMVVLPAVTAFSLRRELKTETNRHPQYRTNVITIRSDTYHLSVSVSIDVLRPHTGTITTLGPFSIVTNGDNRFLVYSAAVSQFSRQLAAKMENSSLFELETEVNQVSGATVYFFNKYPIPPWPGQEFALYRQVRYEDGFIDEYFSATARIIGQYGTFWAARVIQGGKPAPGYRIRPLPRIGLTLSPFYACQLANLQEDRFSIPAATGHRTTAVSLLTGPGLQAAIQLGYNFQWLFEGAWLFGQDLDILQLATGYGWDIYAARNLFFSLRIAAAFRLVREGLGTITDLTPHNGESLTAWAFQPGFRVSLGLNWIIARIRSRFLVFNLETGYSYYNRLDAGDWTFRAGGTVAAGYAPATINPVRTGGFHATAGLSIRL